jgi:hypothetical protein
VGAMSSSVRILVGVLVMGLVVAAGGCTKKAGTVPTQNLMTKWEKPDADDVIPEEETEDVETDAGDAGDEE